MSWMGENNTKKEYTVQKNYNQSISAPDLNLKSTMGINMQSIDTVTLKSLRRRNKPVKEEVVKKEEDIPEISEIYGNNDMADTSSYFTKDDSKKIKSNSILKKIAPENMVAIVTGALLVVFMVLSFVVYGMFTS